MKFFSSLFSAAAVCLLATSCANAASVNADVRAGEQTNPERNNSSPTMSVTGQGSVDITTDLLRVDMTVLQYLNCQGKPLENCNAAKLQKDVNKKLENILALQNELDGIESFQTQGLDLGIRYDYVNNTQVFKGYKSTVQLIAIVKNSVVSKFLNELLQRGVKSIDNTQYYITDKQRKDAQKQCLTLATDNAMKQADAILGALGKARTDIKTVDIPYNADPFVSTQVTPGTLLGDSSSPVTNGLLTVSYKVKMRVGY